MKTIVLATLLCAIAISALAQASAPAASPAASAPKHKLIQKLKNHRPASAAVDPERSPDKKGGQ